MKVAFLVTAYHQPLHLARLIRALDQPWARFFIHVDSKKDIGAFTTALAPSSKVSYLGPGQREKCIWGGFGLVQATLNLINAAITTGETFGRFCLLSGSDYPLRDSETFDSRANYYSFRDYPLLSGISGRIPRKKYRCTPLYGGSGWWSLTGSCVRFALEFIREHPSYLRYHRFVDVPDEMFFHSIVKASPFAKALSYNFEVVDAQHAQRSDRVYGCHYINWETGTAHHPKVLDMTDLPALRSSRALFARKFEESPSRALLEQIDKWRSSKG
jgi:hypothetical protein